ncbi:tyrosinase family oxidase copper chaperone [Lentzea xinjiangensis]|nr:tyrosinase family oxidase copper chaperone [Lentzea xinjiangensis]
MTALGVAGVAFAAPAAMSASGQASGVEHFDEIYRARRIQGLVVVGHERHLPPQSVLIDGRPLHVMRDGNGCFTSAVDHYRPVRSLKEVARKAVDLLQGAELRTGHHGMWSR